MRKISEMSLRGTLVMWQSRDCFVEFTLTVLLIVIPLFLEAGPGTSNFPMIRVGTGARPMGMAGSFVAIADDSHANLWNPAGLTQFDWPEISLTHMIYWSDITEETIVGAYPLTEDLRIGTGIQLINYGDISKTIEKPDGSFDFANSTGSFSPRDSLFGISLAYRFFDWFRLGITGKYMYSTIDTSKIDSLMGDVGALFKFISPLPAMNQITFALVHQNLGSSVNGYQLPRVTRLGMGTQWEIFWPRDLVLGAEVDLPMDAINTKILGGVEYWFEDVVAIRSGYKHGYDLGKFYFGAGIQMVYGSTGYQIDYAFEPATDFGSTHRITLSLKFASEGARGESYGESTVW